MPHFHIGGLGSESVGKASKVNLEGIVGGEKERADHSFTSTEAHSLVCPFNAHK